MDKGYEILCVSQFTLYYSLKGNKLDFHHAMTASLSEPFYNKFLKKLGSLYKPELIKGKITDIETSIGSWKVRIWFIFSQYKDVLERNKLSNMMKRLQGTTGIYFFKLMICKINEAILR